MIRLVITLCACVGLSFLLGKFLPQVSQVAFFVGENGISRPSTFNSGFGVTYLLIAAVVCGVFVWRKTK